MHPEALDSLGAGCGGAPRTPAWRSPAASFAVLPELIRGHPSPRGFDLAGFCVGLVELDAMVTGDRIEPGDAVVGIPSAPECTRTA